MVHTAQFYLYAMHSDIEQRNRHVKKDKDLPVGSVHPDSPFDWQKTKLGQTTPLYTWSYGFNVAVFFCVMCSIGCDCTLGSVFWIPAFVTNILF